MYSLAAQAAMSKGQSMSVRYLDDQDCNSCRILQSNEEKTDKYCLFIASEILFNDSTIRNFRQAFRKIKISNKEDFYNFINAGNNVLRTLEERAPHLNGKKYLEYLVKHNII